MSTIKSQIFKNVVPYTLLFDLLDKICVKENEFYNLTKSSFTLASMLLLKGSQNIGTTVA